MVRRHILLLAIPFAAGSCGTTLQEETKAYCVNGAPVPDHPESPWVKTRPERRRGLPWDLGGKLQLRSDGTFQSFMPSDDDGAMWHVAAGKYRWTPKHLMLAVNGESEQWHRYQPNVHGLSITAADRPSWTIYLHRCEAQTLIAVPPRYRDDVISRAARRVIAGLSAEQREFTMSMPEDNIRRIYRVLRSTIRREITRELKRACLAPDWYSTVPCLEKKIWQILRKDAGAATVALLDYGIILGQTLTIRQAEIATLPIHEAVASLNDKIRDFVVRDSRFRNLPRFHVTLSAGAHPRDRKECRPILCDLKTASGWLGAKCRHIYCRSETLSLFDTVRCLADRYQLDARHKLLGIVVEDSPPTFLE